SAASATQSAPLFCARAFQSAAAPLPPRRAELLPSCRTARSSAARPPAAMIGKRRRASAGPGSRRFARMSRAARFAWRQQLDKPGSPRALFSVAAVQTTADSVRGVPGYRCCCVFFALGEARGRAPLGW
ncbi:unnamed protein product, partial [Amoebophrya sp. A120]